LHEDVASDDSVDGRQSQLLVVFVDAVEVDGSGFIVVEYDVTQLERVDGEEEAVEVLAADACGDTFFFLQLCLRDEAAEVLEAEDGA